MQERQREKQRERQREKGRDRQQGFVDAQQIAQFYKTILQNFKDKAASEQAKMLVGLSWRAFTKIDKETLDVAAIGKDAESNHESAVIYKNIYFLIRIDIASRKDNKEVKKAILNWLSVLLEVYKLNDFATAKLIVAALDKAEENLYLPKKKLEVLRKIRKNLDLVGGAQIAFYEKFSNKIEENLEQREETFIPELASYKSLFVTYKEVHDRNQNIIDALIKRREKLIKELTKNGKSDKSNSGKLDELDREIEKETDDTQSIKNRMDEISKKHVSMLETHIERNKHLIDNEPDRSRLDNIYPDFLLNTFKESDIDLALLEISKKNKVQLHTSIIDKSLDQLTSLGKKIKVSEDKRLIKAELNRLNELLSKEKAICLEDLEKAKKILDKYVIVEEGRKNTDNEASFE